MGGLTYDEFLRNKMRIDKYLWFEVSDSDINPILKPHQKDIVKWALLGGRRAIFAAFGLGKTMMQLEIQRLINGKEGGKQLIIAPLGVRQEFKVDAEKLGIKITPVKWSSDVKEDGLYITNYESVRDGRLDVNLFNSVSLDEAGCLRSYGSKTFQNFLTIFTAVKYRFVATAVPSPNKQKELIHYGGFLGIMDTGQALTRFFQRDSQKANNLTLYPHKEKEFWLWMSTWAIFLQKPSDLGYSDEGYDLPKLNIFYHEVKSNTGPVIDKFGQYHWVNDATISLESAAKEKRESLKPRIQKAVEILNKNPEDHFLLWHNQEDERHAIKKAVKGVVDIWGSLDMETREARVIGFSNGDIKYFASKPVLSGSGCNFQRFCHNAIFLGIDFKFNDFIQSIHRIYRFLQDQECNIHIIYTEKEKGILSVLKQKWIKHDEMVAKMTDIIKKYGLGHRELEEELKRSLGVERVEVIGENFRAINNDAVLECKNIETESIGLVHTSIPFANHYEYTPSYNDFGHTENNDHFWKQMDFLTPDLFRVLKPGRIAAVHIKDRILFGNVTGLGFPSCDNMLEETSLHFQKHGFVKVGIITVVTDVVRENNQTYRLGWTEQCKDGTKMGVGCPEYVVLFRKPQTDRTKGFADEPVQKDKTDYSRSRWQTDAHAFWRSSGDRILSSIEMSGYNPKDMMRIFKEWSQGNVYDYEFHVRLGEKIDAKGRLPSSFMCLYPVSNHDQVWTDIIRMRTLNSEQKRRRRNNHICPLQTDIVNRIIYRYSNEGDIVLDPFGGIGSVPLRAIKMNRKAITIELNTDYFWDSVKYLKLEENGSKTIQMFDIEKKISEICCEQKERDENEPEQLPIFG